MSELNGVKYTRVEMWVTDEELSSIRSKNEGCLKCEKSEVIQNGNFTLEINEDELSIDFEIDKYGVRTGGCLEVQISYCPFCGKKL